ncbi:MAG: cytochrome c biogenesis protein CcsA [Gammaproteobacteria bacterium]|nr:cytochrome c biogenesis protein CcsA [Gammaproteobacteria bacterium]MBT5644629.1 cytochrome c biogenesis protein CcsA [Gammaproteobacteria bacterium]MBT5863892.1 cytochrome c biogenesis protein CcsA [Gammaproteobacteria bacterium]MBT6734095.1 cytochrome c biogenesis protein CcsA [Gammaproteobacteria bacterium]|tara:strand:- start:802 stop:1587 length:786 start_codon:yes stop_codon:yes gene_type:complete
MELIGILTIIGYTLSALSIRYVLIDEEYSFYKKTSFDVIFFLSLLLFSIYAYSLINNVYQKFNFITSLEITFLIVNYLFFLFMFSKPIKHLGLVLLPLTAIVILISMIYHDSSNLGLIDPDLRIHIIVSITSYGFLGLGAIQAILLRYQEKKLKDVSGSLFITILPSIEKMEKVMFDLIIFGFILLTLSLLSGAPFVTMNKHPGLLEKILFSIIAWMTYSYLIYSRFSKGVRGKKATNLTLSGMSFLLIAYLGTKLFFELY